MNSGAIDIGELGGHELLRPVGGLHPEGRFCGREQCNDDVGDLGGGLGVAGEASLTRPLLRPAAASQSLIAERTRARVEFGARR